MARGEGGMSRDLASFTNMIPYFQNQKKLEEKALAYDTQQSQQSQQSVLSEAQQKIINEDTLAQQNAAAKDKSKAMWATMKRPTLLTSPFGDSGGNILKKSLLGQ